MSEPVRTPRRGIRRVVAAALGGAIVASAFVLGPAGSVAAFGGDSDAVFTVQPLGASAWNTPTGQPGVPWSTQPQVSLIGGADPSYDYQATLSISPGSPWGSLSCSGGTTVDMFGGTAQWSGCSIDTSGQGFTLTATVFGVTALGVVLPPMNTVSYAFNIAGGGPQPGSQTLQFTTQPLGANLGSARPSAQAGRAWSIQPVVALVDEYGRPVDNDSTVVSCHHERDAADRRAGSPRSPSEQDRCFNSCSIDTPGTALPADASTVMGSPGAVRHEPPVRLSGGNYGSASASPRSRWAVSGGTVPSAPPGTRGRSRSHQLIGRS
jgi:hypothetical protein